MTRTSNTQEQTKVTEEFKSFVGFCIKKRLLFSCGTYKISFNKINDSKVIFPYPHMGTLSPFQL